MEFDLNNRDISAWMQKIYNIKRRLSITPEQQARTYVYLAANPAVADITGGYWDEHNKQVRSSKNSYRITIRQRLWTETGKLDRAFLISTGGSMEPIKYADLPALKVMGLKYHGDNAHQEISQMWGDLNKRSKEIPIKGDWAYGVCTMLKDAPPGVFEYVAGFKVEEYDKIPEGMVVVDVPANHYAVFAHHGSLETLKATYEHIIHWIHRAALTPQSGYDMEVYTDEFKDFAPDSVFYIYEPTK